MGSTWRLPPPAPCLSGDLWLSLAGAVHNYLPRALPLPPTRVLSLGPPLAGQSKGWLLAFSTQRGRKGPSSCHRWVDWPPLRSCLGPAQLTLVFQAGGLGVPPREAALLPGVEQGPCPRGRSGLGERAGDSRPGTQCAEEPRPATTVPACRGLGHSDRGPSVWGPEVFAPAEGARDAGLTPQLSSGGAAFAGTLGRPCRPGEGPWEEDVSGHGCAVLPSSLPWSVLTIDAQVGGGQGAQPPGRPSPLGSSSRGSASRKERPA